jgi:tripartite-type tricarboxylate transporter receptor subunit TctC
MPFGRRASTFQRDFSEIWLAFHHRSQRRWPISKGIACAVAAALTLFLASPPIPARADSVADFYGKMPLRFIVGAGVGGGYDLYSRMLMEFLPQHLPGKPSVIVEDMPGAGGILAANYLFNVAPKDGSVIAMLIPATVIDEALGEAVEYRMRDFNWIGTISTMTDVLGIRADAGVNSIDEAKKKSVKIGSTSELSQTSFQPALVNALLGTKFKIVNGYKSANAITLAQERNEVQGRTDPWDSWIEANPDWTKNGTIKFILQFGPKLPELPNVPSFSELVKTPKDRAMVNLLAEMQYIGRSVAAPPGVPADRLAALRRAFDETMRDPAFIASLKAKSMSVHARTAAELEGIFKTSSAADTGRALKAALNLN